MGISTTMLVLDTCSVLRFPTQQPLQNGVDAWGITWENGIAATHPMQSMDLTAILNYPLPPLPNDAQCVDFLAEVRRLRRASHKPVVLEAGSTFFPACALFADDEFFVRCITETGVMEQLFSRLAQYYGAFWSKVLSYAHEELHAVQFTENFGLNGVQNIRPELFRRMLKPAQAMLIGQIKRMYPDLPVCYRCTAKAYPLIPDFAEIRYDAWEPLEVTPFERSEITQYQNTLDLRMSLLCGTPASQDEYQYHPLRLQLVAQ